MNRPQPTPDDFLTWFGESWHSEGNDFYGQIETPVGEACDACEQEFVAGDQGVRIPYLTDSWEYYHRRCWEPTAEAMRQSGELE